MKKIESEVDNQSKSSYLPILVQLPNSQWDTENTWNSNDTNHASWALEINTFAWIKWVFNFVNYDILQTIAESFYQNFQNNQLLTEGTKYCTLMII